MIDFKSDSKFYLKEKHGLKNNTLRTFDDVSDKRKKKLDLWIKKPFHLRIRIIEVGSNNSFVRDVKDVSKYSSWYIITWRS